MSASSSLVGGQAKVDDDSFDDGGLVAGETSTSLAIVFPLRAESDVLGPGSET